MNMIRFLSPLIWCFVLSVTASTLKAQNDWIQHYEDNGVYTDILETSQGNLFMAGGADLDSTLLIQLVDPNGGVIWNISTYLNGAQGIAVSEAADGGLLVLAKSYADGSGQHNLLIKLDLQGNFLWQKVLSNGLLANGLQDVVAAPDGSIWLAGNWREPGANHQQARILKLDASGNSLLSIPFGYPNSDEKVSRMVLMANNQIVVSGTRHQGNASDFFLARISSGGEPLWIKTYPKPGYQTAYDLVTTNADGVVLSGDTYQTSPTLLSFLKVDATGNELWFRQVFPGTYSGVLPTTYLAGNLAKDAADNVYVTVLNNISTAQETLSFLKIDAIGDSLFQAPLDTTLAPYRLIHTADNYFVACGHSGLGPPAKSAVMKIGIEGDGYTNAIRGAVFFDTNQNCQQDSSDTSPRLWLVEARNQTGDLFLRPVNAYGQYYIPVNEGVFEVAVRPFDNTPDLWIACDTPQITISGSNQIATAMPIGMQSATDCPRLHAQLAAGLLRRCTEASYQLHCCNLGTQTATEVFVELTADPLMSYVSSSIPLGGQNGNIYTFELPDLEPGECTSVNVRFYVSCDAVLGQTLCVEAHLYPDTACFNPAGLWDGSNLEVSANCDGSVNFTLKNSGNDMTGTVEYVIIEDQIVFMQSMLQLEAGQDSLITIPNPDGRAYYLRTEQRPGHPQFNRPSVAIQDCGGASNQNLALQLPTGDGVHYLDTYCDEIIGSYDPNDKRGFPLGWKEEHYLEKGIDIDYMVRFQNTGNDTAFIVVIRDTLDALTLNPGTVIPGPSSHPYRFEITDNILTFIFENILLPDSTTNEPESNGFVSFRIAQQPDLPDGALIENSAAIYFDFNDPVITNTWFHTIGRPLLSFTPDPESTLPLTMKIWPNPVSHQATLYVTEQDWTGPLTFSLFDANGQRVLQTAFRGNSLLFQKNNLPAGPYFFRVDSRDGRFATGKLLIH